MRSAPDSASLGWGGYSDNAYTNAAHQTFGHSSRFAE